MRRLVALLAIAVTASTSAAKIRTLDIEQVHGRYMFSSDAFLDAPPAAVFAVLTDYDANHFERISSIYKESRYMPPEADGTPLVYTRVEGCVVFFCKTMRRVERLETEPPDFIRATVLPARSDFRYSRAEWTLQAVGSGTLLKYRLEMEPAFWVPPVVGPWLIKQHIIHGGERAVDRIEALARALANAPLVQSAAR